jgi:phenylalanyl-tRNA synthetase alpha subunit
MQKKWEDEKEQLQKAWDEEKEEITDEMANLSETLEMMTLDKELAEEKAECMSLSATVTTPHTHHMCVLCRSIGEKAGQDQDQVQDH